MRLFLTAFSIVAATGTLAGCGMEAAGAAATGAALKQQELQQGRAAQQALEQDLRQALDQSTDRLRQMDEAEGN